MAVDTPEHVARVVVGINAAQAAGRNQALQGGHHLGADPRSSGRADCGRPLKGRCSHSKTWRERQFMAVNLCSWSLAWPTSKWIWLYEETVAWSSAGRPHHGAIYVGDRVQWWQFRFPVR